MSSTRKYVGFNRNERQIDGGATNQFTALRFTADDDMTVLGCHVEIALASEPPIAPGGSSNLAGYARIVVNRAGNGIPVIVPDLAWSIDAAQASQLNDADAGDTWAITAFALGAARIGVEGTSQGSSQNLVLSPATKRKLRRGDTIEVELQYSNGGTQQTATQEAVVGTLFVLTG